MSSLYLIGSIQTIFLSLLILTKRKKRAADFSLFLFIFILGLRLLYIYFDELDVIERYPRLVISEFIFWPLFGPLLYLYITLMISRSGYFNWRYLIHFTPMLMVIISFSGYILSGDPIRFSDYDGKGVLYWTGRQIWYYTTHVYFIFCIIRLHRYRKSIKHYFSYHRHVNLKWLIVLTYGFGIFLFYSLAYILLKHRLDLKIPVFGDHLTWLIMVLYIFAISFFGYRQKGIFNTEEPRIKENKDLNLAGIREQYGKSRLDETEIQSIRERLTSYMEEEEPYLDCELDLKQLAEILNTTTHKLSQVINAGMQRNFFEFVNEYRVKLAKSYLEDPEYSQEKIMSIAYDCGFSSKSTFYSAFRKITSRTPLEYRSECMAEC